MEGKVDAVASLISHKAKGGAKDMAPRLSIMQQLVGVIFSGPAWPHL